MSDDLEARGPGFFARFWLAMVAPWRILFDRRGAARIAAALGTGTAKDPSARPTALPASASAEQRGGDDPASTTPQSQGNAQVIEAVSGPDHTAALQLLSIMQREGRLLDFLNEDVTAFSDTEIGAAARVVHEGCKRGLREHVTMAPVRDEAEGDAIELAPGYDAVRVRITGNVVGAPPFKGRLAHPGWQVVELRLPSLAQGHDPKVVAPAEVEL